MTLDVDLRRLWATIPVLLLGVVAPGPIGAQSVPSSPDTTGYHGLTWKIGTATLLATTSGEILASSPQEPPVVLGVQPCSPAHYAGFEPGDRILTANGRDPREPGPLFPENRPGAVYWFELERGEKPIELTLKLSKAPKVPRQPVMTAPIGTPEKWKCPSLPR